MMFEHCIFGTWSTRLSILLNKLLDGITSFRSCCTPNNPNSCYWHKVDIVLSYTNNQVLMNALYKKTSLSGSEPISWMINVLKIICSSLCSFGDCDNSDLYNTVFVLTAFFSLLFSGNSEKKAFPTRHALIADGLDKILEFSSLLEVYVSI